MFKKLWQKFETAQKQYHTLSYLKKTFVFIYAIIFIIIPVILHILLFFFLIDEKFNLNIFKWLPIILQYIIYLLRLDITINFILFSVFIRLIGGFRFVWSVIKKPGILIEKLSNYYIITLVSIKHHNKLPTKVLYFILGFGAFFALRLVRFMSLEFPLSFLICFFSPGIFLIIFLTCIFILGTLTQKYPKTIGKFVVDFLELHANENILELIGLKKNNKLNKK